MSPIIILSMHSSGILEIEELTGESTSQLREIPMLSWIRGNYLMRTCLSPQVIGHLQTILQDQNGDPDKSGPHTDSLTVQFCPHTSSLLFKPKALVSTLKMDLGIPGSSWLILSLVPHIDLSLKFFTLLNSTGCIVDRCLILSCREFEKWDFCLNIPILTRS